MSALRLSLLLPWVVAVAACVDAVSLRVSGPASLDGVNAKLRLHVPPPKDLRPDEERTSASPGLQYLVPTPPFFMGNAYRGSYVAGGADFTSGYWQDVQADIVDAMRATGKFSEVSTEGGADLTLETEVLHLTSTFFARSVMSFYIGILLQHSAQWIPHATVTIRARLKDRAGKVLGEQVVSGQLLGGLQGKEGAYRHLVPQALSVALAKLRSSVASMVEQFQWNDARAILADLQRQPLRTFVIHQVSSDRREVAFGIVDAATGNVVKSWRVASDSLPVLIGRPGETLLSPYRGGNGDLFSDSAYDAISRHLSDRFVLQRVDHINVYHYLGRRASGASENEKTAAAIREATAAALAWLSLIDARNYDACHVAAASLWRKLSTRVKTRQDLTAARQPLGIVKSRKIRSAKYTALLPNVPPGEYVVLQIDASFARRAAVETLHATRDTDGRWRVVGYGAVSVPSAPPTPPRTAAPQPVRSAPPAAPQPVRSAPPPAPPVPARTRAGCDKDTDCKGNRICENGECVEPSQ